MLLARWGDKIIDVRNIRCKNALQCNLFTNWKYFCSMLLKYEETHRNQILILSLTKYVPRVTPIQMPSGSNWLGRPRSLSGCCASVFVKISTTNKKLSLTFLSSAELHSGKEGFVLVIHNGVARTLHYENVMKVLVIASCGEDHMLGKTDWTLSCCSTSNIVFVEVILYRDCVVITDKLTDHNHSWLNCNGKEENSKWRDSNNINKSTIYNTFPNGQGKWKHVSFTIIDVW